VKKKSVIDFRGTLLSNISPLEGFYCSPADAFILTVPICSIQSSPLISQWLKLVQHIDNKHIDRDKYNELKKILSKYFEDKSPYNVACVLKIKPRLEWHYLTPLHYLMPWENQTPQQAYHHRIKLMKKECSENGMKNYQPSDGWKGFGPVSDRIIEIEVNRLTKVYKSIKKYGYMEQYGFIGGKIFMNGEKQIIRPNGGWHRVAVLKALGYDSIPLMFKKKHVIVRKVDAPYWPGVKKGLFSLSEAREIFNSRYK